MKELAIEKSKLLKDIKDDCNVGSICAHRQTDGAGTHTPCSSRESVSPEKLWGQRHTRASRAWPDSKAARGLWLRGARVILKDSTRLSRLVFKTTIRSQSASTMVSVQTWRPRLLEGARMPHGPHLHGSQYLPGAPWAQTPSLFVCNVGVHSLEPKQGHDPVGTHKRAQQWVTASITW